jgi:VIT1/CCC1 family predicted Fe2+/Mn2+ transporter
MADIERYRENFQDEVDGAALYRAVAAMEESEQLVAVYRRLAEAEDRHRALWERKLAVAGAEVPEIRPSFRARTLIRLARWMGRGILVQTLAVDEQNAQFMYDDQPEANGTSLRAEERSHARLLQVIAETSPKGVEGPALARLEGRHAAVGGNALRAAVLGANDGLVSNLALVMGVAGAAISNQAVVVAGVAGLLAGAISMALGEWLSVQSSRELYKREIRIEAAEIEEAPEEEEEELALIYQAKGLSEENARAMAARIMADRDSALDTLAREELGIDPAELGGSPGEAAGAAVVSSLVLSGAALFVVGAGITLVTGRSVWFSGLRMMGFGLAAAGLTFGIGTLLGVAIG